MRGEQHSASLKSGLYALTQPNKGPNADISLYIIFWPEDTSWDDDASPSVVKNRLTFMRFVLEDLTLYVVLRSVSVI
jgi:hypothetical protein